MTLFIGIMRIGKSIETESTLVIAGGSEEGEVGGKHLIHLGFAVTVLKRP